MTDPAARGLPPWGPLAAVQFLTRIPIRLRREPDMARMVVWFPVAGAIIGLLAGGVGALAFRWTSPLLAGALAVVASLLVTGAFHEDGLADVADGFGGGWTVERRLEIMKDSRHGTYGVVALCSSIVVRVAALASMPDAATVFAAAVAAHTLARGGAVVLMAAMPLVRHDGLGRDYGQATTAGCGLMAAAAALMIGGLAIGVWALLAAASCAAAVVAVGVLAKRKIGGLSGDVLGAAEQVAESAVLVAVGALAGRHGLWWA